jgi:type I restriction enzyme R subunit
VKREADETVLQNTQLLKNESYFDQMMIRLVINQFVNTQDIKLDADASRYINNLVVREYMNEYSGISA